VPERFGEVLFGAAFPQSVASKLWSLDQRCRRSVGVLSLLEWALWFRAFLTRCLRSPLLGRRLPHYPSHALRFLLAQRSGTQAARGSQRQGLSLCTRAASSGFPNDALIIAHRTPVCQGVKGVLRANWGEIRGKFSEIRGRLGARRDPNFVRLLIWSAYPAVSVAKKTENRACEPTGDTHGRCGGRLDAAALDERRGRRAEPRATLRRRDGDDTACPVRYRLPCTTEGRRACVPVGEQFPRTHPTNRAGTQLGRLLLQGSKYARQAIRAARRADGNGAGTPSASAGVASRAAVGGVPRGKRRRRRSERSEPRTRATGADARAHSLPVGRLG
jgi:hypothetical protein